MWCFSVDMFVIHRGLPIFYFPAAAQENVPYNSSISNCLGIFYVRGKKPTGPTSCSSLPEGLRQLQRWELPEPVTDPVVSVTVGSIVFPCYTTTVSVTVRSIVFPCYTTTVSVIVRSIVFPCYTTTVSVIVRSIVFPCYTTTCLLYTSDAADER